MSAKRCVVPGRTIALVRRKVILREILMLCLHETITMHFRNDRSRGNHRKLHIAVNHGELREVRWSDKAAIQQHKRNGRADGPLNLCERCGNSERRRLSYADLINRPVSHARQRITDPGMRPEVRRNALAVSCRYGF